MRFGLDVAQQRMPWDEVVSRVQFAEDLGFDGAWGFDHFQPMYGEGPGETFEGMTTLAALAGVTVAHPARAARGRRDLPAPVGVRRPGPDHRPRLARPARAVARRGVVRQGAHRARHPVPVDARAVRPARGRARDRDPAVHRRGRVLRRARSCRCGTRSSVRCPCSSRTRRSGSAAAGRGGRSRSSPATPTSGTRGARPTRCGRRTTGSTSSPPRPGRDPSSIMRASSLSLDDLDTARKHAGEVAGRGLRLPRLRLARGGSAPRSRRSPATSCPSSRLTRTGVGRSTARQRSRSTTGRSSGFTLTSRRAGQQPLVGQAGEEAVDGPLEVREVALGLLGQAHVLEALGVQAPLLPRQVREVLGRDRRPAGVVVLPHLGRRRPRRLARPPGTG